MKWIQGAFAVLNKDLRLELRSRIGVNSILAFVVSGTLIGVYITGPDHLEPPISMSLFWILVVFAGVSALNRAFVIETDRSTYELLQLHGSPIQVYLGKFIFNALFMAFVSMLTVAFFLLVLGFGTFGLWWLFLLVGLGCLGMSGASTLLSALSSQADRKAALFPALALPMLIPLMLILASASRSLLDGAQWDGLANDIMALIGYCGVTVTASLLLFEYLWDA